MPSWPNNNELSDDDEYMDEYNNMQMEYFDGVNCGVLEWVDAPWPVILQRCLTKLWDMYHEENLSRVQDKEAYGIEDGKKSHDMDYISQAINELKEKKQHLEEHANIEVQMEKLKLKKEQRKAMKEIQVERDLLKEEKKKLEQVISELLKVGHGCKEKLDKIKEVVMKE
nr:uncharacterized protein LOC109785765 [Aegilops tauschii subsp. strangulata]